MYRTVELTCKAEDLSEVLKNLRTTEQFKKEAVFTLQVDIEDEKENYEYLCKSDKIMDWKIIKNPYSAPSTKCNGCSTGEEKKKEQQNPKTPMEEAVSMASGELEEARTTRMLSDVVETIGDISNIIVSTWINLSSPQHRHLKFSTLFFKELVVPYVVERKEDPDNTNVSIDLFIKTYYKDIPTLDILKDIVKKIREKWENIKKLDSFPKIVGLLFGPGEDIKKILGLC